MSPRLAAKIEVSALVRRIEGLGGTGTVLARGDDMAGTVLLYVADRGRFCSFLERRLDETGAYRWARVGPQDIECKQEVDGYMSRRRAVDRDLWILELDVAGSERFIADMVTTG